MFFIQMQYIFIEQKIALDLFLHVQTKVKCKQIKINYTKISVSKICLPIIINILIFLIIKKCLNSYLPLAFLIQTGDAYLLMKTAAVVEESI